MWYGWPVRGAGWLSVTGRSPLFRRGEGGRPLLANRLDALAHVRIRERQHLERERLVEDRTGLTQPVVERALGPADRVLAALGEPIGDVEGLRHELVERHAHAHEADALGLPAVDEVRGEQVVFRLRHAAENRPEDRRVVAGGDAQARVAVGEPRGLRD